MEMNHGASRCEKYFAAALDGTEVRSKITPRIDASIHGAMPR
jgi:hypothetical protein